MDMRSIVVSMIVILASVSTVLAASPERIACPDRVEVAAQTLAKKIPDWRYFEDTDSKYLLDTVTVYKGKKKLEKMEPSKGTEAYTEWLLPDNGKESYFVVCSYQNTSIRMKRALSAKLNSCRVAYETDPNNPHALPALHKFTCE